eukprot:scaffold2888_cov274-Pinguiococcus_pyrenoidosus.AAC.14
MGTDRDQSSFVRALFLAHGGVQSMDILITNVDASTLLPSFFELVLQQSLDECLTPALAHILPRSDRAGILKGALDSLSLIGFGSLASERLCGFSRASEGAAPLKRGRRAALSVALWVLLPPLWSALEASLKRRGDRVTRSVSAAADA